MTGFQTDPSQLTCVHHSIDCELVRTILVTTALEDSTQFVDHKAIFCLEICFAFPKAMDVPIAANVLGTLGAVFWSIQLIPQIVVNYRRHNATGLQPSMVFTFMKYMRSMY